MTTTWIRRKSEGAQQFYKTHQRYVPALFFVAGFLFDVITLDRIDSPWIMFQQAVYLGLLLWMLVVRFQRAQASSAEISSQPHPLEELKQSVTWSFKVRRIFHEYELGIIHFLFGSLLSAYTLFYLKSSSLMASGIFLIFMVLILVLNEVPLFQLRGLALKFALLTLCLISFSGYVVPVVMGQIGVWVFLFSWLIGLFPIVVLGRLLRRRYALRSVREQVTLPALGTALLFVLLYLLKWIPPVPLSLYHVGVYHSVMKQDGGYQLRHERPWWRFWHTGDQVFKAQPGDQVHIFFRLFSPARFEEEVRLAWYQKVPNSGWELRDQIPIRVTGGRDEGFRGFGYKSHYTPGDWKVLVMTRDGREIGRISLTIESVPESPRVWVEELQ